MSYSQEHGPFGKSLDELARKVGRWPDTAMVYGLRVIGDMDRGDPQVLLTGSDGTWMPRAKRWKFHGPDSQAVIRLSEYRAALAKDDA